MLRPRPRLTLLGALLLVGLGLLVERLIVTDAEAVEGLLEDARRAVQARDLAGLRPLLDDAFVWNGLGPDEAVRRLQREVDRSGPTRIDVSWGAVEPRGDACDVAVHARVFAYGGLLPLEGRLTFVRTSAGWRIREASGPW